MNNLLNCNNETLTLARQSVEADHRRFRPDVPEGVGSHLAQMDPSTMFAPQTYVEQMNGSAEMLLFSRRLYIGHYRQCRKKPGVSDHIHYRDVCPDRLHRFPRCSAASALPLNIRGMLYHALNMTNNVNMRYKSHVGQYPHITHYLCLCSRIDLIHTTHIFSIENLNFSFFLLWLYQNLLIDTIELKPSVYLC